MSCDIQRDYELCIYHRERSFEYENPDTCAARIVETTPGIATCEAVSSFDAILDKLEYQLGLSESSLIKIMGDYAEFGCSTLKLTTTPAKLRSAGLLNRN